MDQPAHRTFLYVPAHRERPLNKALSGATGADVVIVDLEDGVPLGQRGVAEAALTRISQATPAGVEVLCRIRSGRDQRLADARLTPPWFAGVLLAKAEDPDDIGLVAEEALERGISRTVWLLVESARGVESLPAMLSTGVPIAGIMLGAGDLRADLGLFDITDERALDYARSRMVYASRAAGVREIVDGPDAQIEPTDQYRAATRSARDLGFTGRAAIHPGQLAAIASVYQGTYTAEQREWAHAVLQMPDGAQQMDGELVDEAVKRWARRIELSNHREDLEVRDEERTS